MKVTIDTKEDSHADIKKVLAILSHMINQKEESSISNFNNDTVKEKKNVDTTNMMSMFGSTKESVKEVADTPPDFSSLMDLTNVSNEKKDDDKAKIEFF
jgi:hypothetical protein